MLDTASAMIAAAPAVLRNPLTRSVNHSAAVAAPTATSRERTTGPA
ncbi:Uncharacterised protein [Mycobacteroides abscessus subsp. abscessus]|nr:Uncharacterised protein [Mycobacteroides abscessus subsp. abscessus]